MQDDLYSAVVRRRHHWLQCKITGGRNVHLSLGPVQETYTSKGRPFGQVLSGYLQFNYL